MAVATSTALMVASAAYSAVASMKQASATAKTAKYQAEFEEKALKIQLEENRAKLVREQRAQMGESIVSGAASGSGIATYSELYQDDLEQKAVDIATMNYNTALNISSTWYESNVKSSQAKAEGKAALMSSAAKVAGAGYSAYSSMPSTGTLGGVDMPVSSTVSQSDINWS